MKIMSGHLYRNTQTFELMDPFILVENKGIKYKIKLHENGGLAPKWNEMLVIRMKSAKSKVRIICFDEDLTMDSCVGEVRRTAEELCGGKRWERLYFEK